ncbi:MAG: transposase [Gemmatimonadales bacterium]|nr:transposase [Gemmatimonadales bacterium]MYC87216.1 transposase [Candidatus Palauibacter denitrificans]
MADRREVGIARRRYTPKLKAQVVLEVLSGEKAPGQVAKAYGVHPNSVRALEAALRGGGAGDLRRGHGGQRVRAPDPRPGAAPGQEGSGDRASKNVLGRRG